MSGDTSGGLTAMVDRLARLEEQSRGRGEAFRDMKASLEKLDAKIDKLSDDISGKMKVLEQQVDDVKMEVAKAQSGFRVALWFTGAIASVLSSVATWAANHLFGK